MLAVVGWLLITPPLLPIMPRLIFGFPVTALYLTTVWLGLLGAVVWVMAAGDR